METGESAAPPVEMDSNSAHAPAPIPLRLMVGRNVLDPTKRPGHVTINHAKVGKRKII